MCACGRDSCLLPLCLFFSWLSLRTISEEQGAESLAVDRVVPVAVDLSDGVGDIAESNVCGDDGVELVESLPR